MLGGRGDWCLSRQRYWGVPIPAFYDPSNDHAPVIDAQTTQYVRDLVAQHGSSCWFDMDADELLPPGGQYRGRGLVKGLDTMDVWFDSGASWAAVLQQQHPLKQVADVYLEGSDQHRGWFQSSLITSAAAQGTAPFKVCWVGWARAM
jgi:isoleucyl-tRNA synthetase